MDDYYDYDFGSDSLDSAAKDATTPPIAPPDHSVLDARGYISAISSDLSLLQLRTMF